MSVRLLQVGMNRWGQDWLQTVICHSEDVKLVGCVDTNATMLAQVQQNLDMPAEQCFSSVQDALAATEVDAVLITTGPAGHAPVALEALAAGKHVLVEKPFAPTLAEAQQVVSAASEQQRVLMVNQNYRFYPAVRTVTALLRDGSLGAVGSVVVEFRRYGNGFPRESHPHYRIPHPLLIDMSIHHFDMMRMVLGQEACEVLCQTWNPPWSHFVEPPAAVATILFERGTVVSYRGSWVSHAPQTGWGGEWRMECEGGEIVWSSRGENDPHGDAVWIRPIGEEARPVVLPEMPHVDRVGSLAAFARAIRTGETTENSGLQNLGSVALMNAAVESATSGLRIPVPSV